MIVMRLWRYLAIRRRSGQEHNIDAVLTQRRPGSLTVRCPACPEIGHNIEESVVELSNTSKTWVPLTAFPSVTYKQELVGTSTHYSFQQMAILNFNARRRMTTLLTSPLMMAKGTLWTMRNTANTSRLYLVIREMFVFHSSGVKNFLLITNLCRVLSVRNWRPLDSKINLNSKTP